MTSAQAPALPAQQAPAPQGAPGWFRLLARSSSSLSPRLAALWLDRLFTSPTRRPVKQTEQAWMNAAVRSSVLFRPGMELPVYSWGAGPTVLLVHGMSGRASQLSVLAQPLVAAAFKVVAFDAPAHGEAAGTRTLVPEIALALLAVAQGLGPLAAVVAHSVGSAATTIALSQGLQSERVVFLAPPDNLRAHLDAVARTLGFSPEVVERVQQRIEARYSLPFDQARGSYLARSLNTPALFLHDRNDRVVPLTEAQRLQQAWPGAQLIITKGLGHNRILGDALVIRQMLEFLTGAPALSTAA